MATKCAALRSRLCEGNGLASSASGDDSVEEPAPARKVPVAPLHAEDGAEGRDDAFDDRRPDDGLVGGKGALGLPADWECSWLTPTSLCPSALPLDATPASRLVATPALSLVPAPAPWSVSMTALRCSEKKEKKFGVAAPGCLGSGLLAGVSPGKAPSRLECTCASDAADGLSSDAFAGGTSVICDLGAKNDCSGVINRLM